MSLNYEEILSKIKPLILEAGSKVKQAFESREIIDTSIEEKDSNPTDLVTQVDKSVEQYLFSSLRELYPTFDLIGEETVSSSESKKVNLTDIPTWVIDPVDGTTNFVHGFPFVCICVGLCVNKKPVLGVVYNPIIKKSLFITEYGYFLGKEKLDIKVGNAKSMLSIPAHGVRSLGSCAMDMCQVAKGGADFYFEIGIHTWDVAAATVIIRESGGAVVGYKRPEGLDDNVLIVDEPYDLNQRKVLCIRSTKEGKEFQSKLLEEVRKNLKEFDIESD